MKKVKLIKVDEEIHTRVKVKTSELGISIKSFIETLINEYFEKDVIKHKNIK